jgi:dTDP-4-amino-4,6-dideoxygalactose transaminase
MRSNTLQVPFVDLAAQYAAISGQVVEAMARVLTDTDFILGHDVELFEREFAEFCEADYAVGVDSGTSALELALRACDIGPGDEVITAANTFIATALAISYTGATPVFVDIDPDTYNMDPRLLEKAITPRTRAIIPVHLYGQPADMDPILDIARSRNLSVIEDACQAHGARYKGRRVGSLGHLAAFSFYPAKNLGAYGDGGMVVTNDKALAESIKLMRNYGQREKNTHLLRGFNRRLDTLQAAVLRVKLRHLDKWNEERRQHARRYTQYLSDTPFVAPFEAEYGEPVYHLYVIRTQDRDGLRGYLQQQGISTGIHYPTPIHLQEAYRDLGYHRGSFPIAEEYAEQVLSLPMYAELSPGLIRHVTESLRAAKIEPARETSALRTPSAV